MIEHTPYVSERHVEAAKTLELRQREVDDLFRRLGIAGDGDLRRRAADEIQHHMRRHVETRQHEGRIDAALEAVARVGIDGKLAAGPRNVDRLPQRRFDQHIGGGLVAAGFLAAHDAGERFNALVVGDDAHRVVERVGLAVERQQGFAGLGAAHREMAFDFFGIEHMQRPAAVKGDEIGDIDQRIDRAQPDRDQPLLQPIRRRAVLDATYETQREGRAQRRRRAEIELNLHRGRKLAFDLLDRLVLELAHVGCREIAGDAVHAGAIGPVRREVDLDQRIVELGPLRKACPDRRVSRQLDDAVVIVGDLQLGFRDQHAPAFDVADLADPERDVLAGDEGAGRREHADHAGARVRRAAHDLDRLAVAGIDHADAQPIGIGMLFRLDDFGDDEGREQLRLVLEALDFEPDHGELVGDLAERTIGVEMLLQPGEGEFH